MFRIFNRIFEQKAASLFSIHIRKSHCREKLFEIGHCETMLKRFSAKDVESFAHLSGDRNPLHTQENFAKSFIEESMLSKYVDPSKSPLIVHGMLVASLFSALFGSTYPGSGAIYLGQSLKFTSPVFVDELVQATIKLKSVKSLDAHASKTRHILTFETLCEKVDNHRLVAISGQAEVLVHL